MAHIIHADYLFNYVEGQRKSALRMDLNCLGTHSEKAMRAIEIFVALLTDAKYLWEIIVLENLNRVMSLLLPLKPPQVKVNLSSRAVLT